MIDHTLLGKYNKAVPRYTSYPTVPSWDGEVKEQKWKHTLHKSFFQFNKKTGVSLYIHLPFCESLCTYCGCNKRITKNHEVEMPYLNTLLKEWQLYKNTFRQLPYVKEIHLGGGTPTFFSAKHLSYLIGELLKDVHVAPDASFSFEAHPANTRKEHLKELQKLGFNRVSYGIQDFDLRVQKAIHRFQSFEQVKQTVKEAREVGYESINFDLIYGLPFQTTDGLLDTLKKTVELSPERIAYYSYAHVPKTAKGQRAYNENDLPSANQKLLLYHLGKKFLIKNGYKEIGMDHYVKENDSMYKAQTEKRLHRNFMGYTTTSSKILVGLGVSAISDSHYAYSQNVKTIEEYEKKVNKGDFPIVKQHYLSEKQIETRTYINELMCNFDVMLPHNWFEKLSIDAQELLFEMQEEGLIKMDASHLHVNASGRQYIRNICTAFDSEYWESGSGERIFSKSI